MTVPGSNLLNRAMQLLGKQSFSYYAFSARAPMANGVLVPFYSAPVTLTGSIQAVPRRLYEIYGLDLQKYYYTVYVSQNVLDVARDVSGDQIMFNSLRLQCESKTDWFAMDGWDAILAVQVPNNIANAPNILTTNTGDPITTEDGYILTVNPG